MKKVLNQLNPQPMKSLIHALAFLMMSSQLNAQLQFRPLPDEGFEERIENYVASLEIVDSHEHLMSQESVKNSSMMDFMLLLHHYADDDIKSAGLGKAEFAELLTDKYTVKEKWDIIKPYWEASSNTAYGRTVLLAMEQLFGITELSHETVEPLSKMIKNAYKGDWYEEVMKEKAKIKYAIMDIGSRRMEDPMFRYVEKFDEFIRIFSRDDILGIGRKYDVEVSSLVDYENMLDKAFEAALLRKSIGIKSALAYHRPLRYDNVSKPVAEKVFSDLMKSGTIYEFEQVKPLQDYMMHCIIKLARKHDIPMQIHTGLQAGDGNYIANANPSHLANLFLEYRDVNFILMHGAYPYGGQLSALAKGFRNVFVEMSWVYIISPSYAVRYLHEWIETVPANKILAFGGDYHNVENTYAHSLVAREIVAQVLKEKVASGYLSEAEAIKIAKMILHDNAITVFKIE